MANFTITLGGQGAEPEDVDEIFVNAVRALRLVGDGNVDGSVFAGRDGGDAIAYPARDVPDAPNAADVDEEEEG